MRPRVAIALVAILASVAACGGESSYRVPASSPMKPFVAPDREDLVDDEDGEDLDAADDDSAAPVAAPAPPAVPQPAPPAAPQPKPPAK